MKRSRSPYALLAAGAGALLGLQALIRRAREIDLHGRTVLITGASRGLGLVLAREFAREGAQVALCARDWDELKRAVDDLRERGARAVAIQCDVGDRAQVERMVHFVQERFGGIDVLVNNAGIIEVGPMEEMNLQDYADAMQTNFWAPLFTSMAVLPQMRARGEGRIVNIASIGGKISVPHLLPYNASKFALVGLSEGMRAELAHAGIRVTTVCPGLMRTGGAVNATFKGQHRKEYAWFSISDALPVVSVEAEWAARKIVQACRRGAAEVILPLHTKLAAKLYAMFPALGQEVLALIHRMLPAPGGIGQQRALGKESYSAASPSWMSRLGDEAARRNNESPEPSSITSR